MLLSQLSASEIPKLPTYGIYSHLLCHCLGIIWFQFLKRKIKILPLKRYLLAMFGILTFDCSSLVIL